METGFIILAVGMLIVGIIIGLLIGVFRRKREKTMGTIYVYYHDEETDPSLLLDPDVTIDTIASQKRVIFDVTIIQ